ncbi:hypothetical protein L1787_02370 [Acuticoccus sp. M5D2P5]|uniref:hypothetical protein n=1 Tax=Acuticoccus kalidii TaxID=2910977 RepID=UPI001F396C3F|nr:hypothetical protein [Acuticoccus kalidii]MCF3932260.1 hypothetical protein [Acuticoccus kalidii]
MLTVSEIVRSLNGAWLLFLGRREGLDLLDRSAEGFWRSFAVILLLLPLNAVTILAVARSQGVDKPFNEMFLEGLPVLALDWVAFPIVLAFAAGMLGVKRTYTSYIVARNWMAPVAAAILAIPVILQGAGWIGPTTSILLSLISMGLVLRYHYLVVRLALETTVGLSIGLVVVDLLLTLVFVGLFS